MRPRGGVSFDVPGSGADGRPAPSGLMDRLTKRRFGPILGGMGTITAKDGTRIHHKDRGGTGSRDLLAFVES
jgi:hypothetical protein